MTAGSNKLRIPFVQGKFNMGGTGVFLFCGDRSMQIMISKRHPEIVVNEKNDSSSKDWCFTVVRREDPKEGQKSSVFTYLAPKGKIPRFNEDSLPLFPSKYPESLGVEIEHGTFIKIIEYQIPRYKTNITLDMYNRLNCLLPRMALPVRLWERRKGWGKGTHTFETTLSGLSVRLEEDKRGMLEFSSSSSFEIDGTSLPTTIYAFKKAEQASRYRNEEGVIFVQNGQTHGHFPKDFLKRKNVGMLNLADILLVEVNCDSIGRRANEKLFMTSRDRLRQGQLKKDIEQQLTILISEHQGLRELRERKRREEVKERLAKSKPLENVLERIVKNSPTLAKILGTGMRITNPFKDDKAVSTTEFEGKKFPTYFDLFKGKSGEFVKNCHIKQRYRVQFKTDAEDNYFRRDVDAGDYTVNCDGEDYNKGIMNLFKGVATLNLQLPEEAKVGDILELKVDVTDPSRVSPFTNIFKVKILEPVEKTKNRDKGERKPPRKMGNGTEKQPGSLGIPEVVEVTQDKWDKYDFDKESALKLRQGEEDYYFLCNIDNVYLQNEQKLRRNIDSDLLKEQYKYGLSLVALALLNEDEKKQQSKIQKDNENNEGSIDEEVFNVTKAMSPFILPIVRELGSIDN